MVDHPALQRFTTSACAGSSAVVFMQVDGGGRTWPGGTQYLPKVSILKLFVMFSLNRRLV